MGVVASLVNASTEVELNNIDVKTKQQEIDTLKQLQQEYQIQLEKKDKSLEELQKLQEAQEQLQKENERLQQELALKQAKQAEERSRRNIIARTITPTASAVSYGGDCASWIAQAGISDVANANELIRRESNCNPNAVNSSSGACGIAQELPCGKSGCSLGDGACQVKWMANYVANRYGSWANAVAFHNANNWY